MRFLKGAVTDRSFPLAFQAKCYPCSNLQTVPVEWGTVMKRCVKQVIENHRQLSLPIDSTSHSIEVSKIAQAVFLSGAGIEHSFKPCSRLRTKINNRLHGEGLDERSFIVFNCGQIYRVNTAFDTPQSSVLYDCLINGVIVEKGKGLLRNVSVTIIDEE